MQSQTAIPASPGGISNVSLPIPAGTCCARVQPTLADSDWTAGQQLTVTIHAEVGGEVAPDAPQCVLQTGALQGNPSLPQPAYGQLNNPSAWPFDTILVTVTPENSSVSVGAVVSFSDTPANMPAPILPPGYAGPISN